MRTVTLIAVTCDSVFLAGCNSDTLVFGKVNTLGVQIAATAPDQGGNLTLGYRSANIAVVPVVARDAAGQISPVYSTQNVSGTSARDSLSTFAHFEAQAGIPATACLGDTFATGLAAHKLAQNLLNVCGNKKPGT